MRGQTRSHLVSLGSPNRVIYRHTHRQTDKYDLKVRHSTLRTVTNCFTLRARNNTTLANKTKRKPTTCGLLAPVRRADRRLDESGQAAPTTLLKIFCVATLFTIFYQYHPGSALLLVLLALFFAVVAAVSAANFVEAPQDTGKSIFSYDEVDKVACFFSVLHE
uniref:Uncharacterized protein n=1 Tax=Hyaloperonospora arabidopsidis (strain Emoy2) TaxID=559515 RepID=M4BDZ6_HYAAE